MRQIVSHSIRFEMRAIGGHASQAIRNEKDRTHELKVNFTARGTCGECSMRTPTGIRSEERKTNYESVNIVVVIFRQQRSHVTRPVCDEWNDDRHVPFE